MISFGGFLAECLPCYLQLAAKLALESVRKEVEGSSRGAKIGQGVQHGGGKQATRGRGRGRRRGEQVSKSFCVILGIEVCSCRSWNSKVELETSSLSSLGLNLLKNQTWRF